MTRRAFFALPFLGTIQPTSGFVFTGRLTEAGQENPRYYAIGPTGMCLMIDKQTMPDCASRADALLNQDVEISLRRLP